MIHWLCVPRHVQAQITAYMLLLFPSNPLIVAVKCEGSFSLSDILIIAFICYSSDQREIFCLTKKESYSGRGFCRKHNIFFLCMLLTSISLSFSPNQTKTARLQKETSSQSALRRECWSPFSGFHHRPGRRFPQLCLCTNRIPPSLI